MKAGEQRARPASYLDEKSPARLLQGIALGRIPTEPRVGTFHANHAFQGDDVGVAMLPADAIIETVGGFEAIRWSTGGRNGDEALCQASRCTMGGIDNGRIEMTAGLRTREIGSTTMTHIALKARICYRDISMS